MRKWQKTAKPVTDRELNEAGFVIINGAELVPIEDIKTLPAVLKPNQLTPLRAPTIESIDDLAYRGLSMNGIVGATGLTLTEIKQHYSKTIAQGRARRALELLEDIQDSLKPTPLVDPVNIPMAMKLLDRVDPMEKPDTDKELSPAEQLLGKFIGSFNFDPNSPSKQELREQLKKLKHDKP